VRCFICANLVLLNMFDYDINRTIEALLYLCEKMGGSTKHQLSKMLYFADKYHLKEFGRTITGDKYTKMEYGPVPSQTYHHLRYSEFINDIFEVEGYHVKGKRDSDKDELSESDRKALDFSIQEYGTLSFGELTDVSHDATWEAAKDNAPISFDDFLLTFDEPVQKEIKSYLAGE